MKNHSADKLIVAVFLVAAMFGGLAQVSCQSLTVSAQVFPERASTLDSLVSLVSFTGSAESVGVGNFSMIWITDTQYLAERYPTYFDSLCRWIVKNADKYNVQMVIHTGDIVDTEGNRTQWENANQSMSVLLDAEIPYCWNAGNHDYNATCWMANEYTAFNPTTFTQKSYWVSDYAEGKSTAVHFTVNGMDFLVINLEFNTDNATLAWANSLLDTYPNSHAIIGAHFYLNRTGGYEAWASNLKQTVLATHQNVFLTLSAHVYPLVYSGIRTQVGDRQELVFNRQDKDSEMGAASLRILTFDTADNMIDVKTYVIYSNTFLTDENNQFTLNTNFWNEAAATEEIPEFPSTILAATILAVVAGAGAVLRKAKKASKLAIPAS